MIDVDHYVPKLCADGRYSCTRTEIQRHFFSLLRFLDKTNEVVLITYRGKDDLVIMSYNRYAGMLEAKATLESMLLHAPKENSDAAKSEPDTTNPQG